MCPISGAANHVDAEVRTQRFGHHHAAVGLLVVFEDRQPGAPNRESAAVDGVHEIGFTAAGFSLNRRAPRSFLPPNAKRLAGGTEQAASEELGTNRVDPPEGL